MTKFRPGNLKEILDYVPLDRNFRMTEVVRQCQAEGRDPGKLKLHAGRIRKLQSDGWINRVERDEDSVWLWVATDKTRLMRAENGN